MSVVGSENDLALLLPPPLRGRVGVGGSHTLCARGTPTPDPSPQGGGEQKRARLPRESR